MILLFEYQQSAINRLRSGSILYGGVGSGKSRTALAYYMFKECEAKLPLAIEDRDGNIIQSYDTFEKMKNPKDLYIITTAKKRDSLDWDKEMGPFLMAEGKNNGFCGTSVTVDSWNNIGKYANICNSVFIFDEQRLVGSGAWVKAFLKIAKKNHWILLSGTPGDTWLDYIPVFIANGFYRNRTEFITEHVIFNRFSTFPKVDRYVNVAKLIKMKKRVLVPMDYSSSHTSHVTYVNTSYDKESYRIVAEKRWNIEKNFPIQNKSEYCLLLRKIVNSDQSRIEALKQVIKDNVRLIIFYNFDYELEIIRNACRELDVSFAEWNGKKHMPVPQHSDKWVYIVQYAAGAEAWECTETDTILFYSLNYSYKINTQAQGRIDRNNSPFSDLYMIYLVSESSIDKSILKCLSEKRDFNINTDI